VEISTHAQQLHTDSIVIDPCVQYLIKRTERSDSSGLTAVGLTIPRPGGDMVETMPYVRDFLDVIVSEPQFCLGDTPQAIRDAHAAGKLAHLFLSQDSNFVGTNTSNLLIWKQLGLRIMQITYNELNPAGAGCLELNDGGLSQFGKVLIREMERVGITLDLTHVGAQTFMDACQVATAPVITSHSNPRAIAENPRNISDDQIRAIADSGGVVCVTTWAPLIWNGTPGMPTLSDYIRCLEYTIDLVGIDHVGVSTDSMGTMGAYPKHDFDDDALPYGSVTDEFDRLAQPADNNNRQPADFNGIEDFPYLTHRLVESGYSDEDIKKILGENLMRVFDATWRPNYFG
jgi:membrane dipeptidase